MKISIAESKRFFFNVIICKFNVKANTFFALSYLFFVHNSDI